MFDGKADTCWTSDAGPAQELELTLGGAFQLTHVAITFQGGFASQHILLSTRPDDTREWTEAADIVSEDTSKRQLFAVSAGDVREVRLQLEKPADLYGRVTIYSLELFGVPAA